MHRATKLIYNDVTLHCQLRANKIKSLKGTMLNQFRVHEALVLLVIENPYYNPPEESRLKDLDQEVATPDDGPVVGSSGLSWVEFVGEALSQNPMDVHSLCWLAYSNTLAPQGKVEEDLDIYGSETDRWLRSSVRRRV